LTSSAGICQTAIMASSFESSYSMVHNTCLIVKLRADPRANRSTRTMLPMFPPKPSSRMHWRREQTNPRLKQWYRQPSSTAPLCGTALTNVQKRILSISMNGDPQTGLLMHIIRFVMPSKSKPLKKLMYLFLEVCPKHDSQGKLRQEWILVWCVHTNIRF
jgi:hypothetical protein